MKFYAHLSEVAHGVQARLVAVTAENVAANQRFLESNGVWPDSVLALKSVKLRLSGTPTLIVVAIDGSVVKSWVGKLDSTSQADVLGVVKRI